MGFVNAKTGNRQHVRRGMAAIEYAALIGVLSATAVAGMVLLKGGTQSAFQSANQITGGQKPAGGSGSSTVASSLTATGTSLFQDNFQENDASKKWQLEGKTWSEKNGTLQVGYPYPAGEQRAFAVGVNAGDISIKMDGTMFQGNGYGIIFRATGDLMTGYTFQYDKGYENGRFLVRKWVNGYEIWPPIAAVAPPKGFSWYGVDHQLQFDAKGTSFTAKVDGQTVLQTTDSSYRSGGVGIRVWDSTQASFNSFSVN